MQMADDRGWLKALRAYSVMLLVGNLLWEIAQLPLYTLWHTATLPEIAFSVLHCTGGDFACNATQCNGATKCNAMNPEDHVSARGRRNRPELLARAPRAVTMRAIARPDPRPRVPPVRRR